MEEIFEAMSNHPIATFFFGWFCVIVIDIIAETFIRVAKILKNKED